MRSALLLALALAQLLVLQCAADEFPLGESELQQQFGEDDKGEGQAVPNSEMPEEEAVLKRRKRGEEAEDEQGEGQAVPNSEMPEEEAVLKRRKREEGADDQSGHDSSPKEDTAQRRRKQKGPHGRQRSQHNRGEEADDQSGHNSSVKQDTAQKRRKQKGSHGHLKSQSSGHAMNENTAQSGRKPKGPHGHKRRQQNDLSDDQAMPNNEMPENEALHKRRKRGEEADGDQGEGQSVPNSEMPEEEAVLKRRKRGEDADDQSGPRGHLGSQIQHNDLSPKKRQPINNPPKGGNDQTQQNGELAED